MMGPLFVLNTSPSWCCAIGALISALMYGAGLIRIWGRAGIDHGVSVRQVIYFVLGWSAAIFPAVTALHTLGRQVFVLHMLEHEILMVVAAPLLVLARPLPVLLWSLPARCRRALRAVSHSDAAQALWRGLTDPLNATAFQGLALWIWHWPPFFQVALFDESVHVAQHLSFLITALLLWWSVLAPRARRGGPVAGALALFVTTVHTSLLGAWVTFSRGFWYSEPYLGSFCGLTRVQDQQLAGLVMWIPASLIYVGAALYLLSASLRAEDDPDRTAKRGTRNEVASQIT